MSAGGSITVQTEQGGVEVVERLAPEWRGLCDEEGNNDPRYRPEWIAAYLSAFAPQARILVVAARSDGRLKAILPLMWEQCLFNGLPTKKLSTLPRITATRFELVVSPGPERSAAIAAVWKCLKNLPGWQMLELGNVQLESPLHQLFLLAQADRYPTGVVRTPPNPYLPIPHCDPKIPFPVEPRSRNHRTKLRKVLRELAGPPERLRFSRVDGLNRDALQRFYQLEAGGWKGREGSAILCVPAVRQFYDQLTEATSRLGYFTLYELYLDGQHVAGHLGFTYRGGYFTPKGAYDERYRIFSVGHIIVLFIMRDCAQQGIRMFEFLGGPDDWKMLWTSNVHELQICSIFRRNPLGYLRHATEFHMKPAAKKLAAGARAYLSRRKKSPPEPPPSASPGDQAG